MDPNKWKELINQSQHLYNVAVKDYKEVDKSVEPDYPLLYIIQQLRRFLMVLHSTSFFGLEKFAGNEIPDYSLGIILRSGLYDFTKLVFIMSYIPDGQTILTSEKAKSELISMLTGPSERMIKYYKQRKDAGEISEVEFQDYQINIKNLGGYEQNLLEHRKPEEPSLWKMKKQILLTDYKCLAMAADYHELLSKYEHVGFLTPWLTVNLDEVIENFAWSIYFIAYGTSECVSMITDSDYNTVKEYNAILSRIVKCLPSNESK